jgi:hypothetical protein
MVPAFRILVASLFLALAACSEAPELDPATLRAIAAESAELLARSTASQTFGEDEWPGTIASLEPESVNSTRNSRPDDGLYIAIGGFLVLEWGYFVPANKSEFQPAPGSDPSFELLGAGVYWYEIQG